MRRGLVLTAIVCALWTGGCGNGQSPTAPSAIAVTTPAVGASTRSVSGRAAIGPLSFSMPLVIGDSANVAFGLAPFGYHDADRAAAGHSGWDIEFRAGGLVRAAADGTVLNIAADPAAAGRTVVEIEHSSGDHFYRTVYTNLSSITADVMAGEAIARGQVLGVAGSLTLSAGNTSIAYSTIHFQIDDFDFYAGGIPNPNAVSPELVLSADGRAVFDRIWPSAVFAQELTEPFATNSRAATFPLRREWYLESGEGPVGISFTRRTPRSSDYEFATLAASGTALESGTVTLRYTSRPLQSIDLVAATSVRLGVYDIVDSRMRLAIAAPGSPRPVDLSGAAVYGTTRAQ